MERHGKHGTQVYKAWEQMVARCSSKSAIRLERYGSRGITVCEKWRKSFVAFFADMGEPPSKRHSLDRKDNNGNYTPENCQWGTREQQARNKRNSRKYLYRGKLMTIYDAVEMAGSVVSPRTADRRVRAYEWAIERAVETPTFYRGQS